MTSRSAFRESIELIASASSAIEWLASTRSNTVFSYDLAEDLGFGSLTKEWSKEDGFAAKAISLQTRAGAGLTLIGRLLAAPSKDGRKGSLITAYTTPDGLAQMAPALALSPRASAHSRLVVQVPAVTPVGSHLSLSPTLAPLSQVIFTLPESFAVILSATPQEAVSLSSLAYGLSQYHVVHVFDHHGSAREKARITIPPPNSSDAEVSSSLPLSNYEFFDCVGDKNAGTALILLNGPLASVAKALASHISDLVVISVRVLRPWNEEMLRTVLPGSVKYVHVLDDVPSAGVPGGLFADVMSTLSGSSSSPIVKSHRHTPERLQRYLSDPDSLGTFVAHLTSPISDTNGPSRSFALATEAKRLLFLSSDSGVGTKWSSSIADVFLSHDAIHARYLSMHDAFSRAGGITAERLILSSQNDVQHVPASVLLPLDRLEEGGEGCADFIAVTDQSLFKTHSIFHSAKRAGSVLILTNWTPQELLANFPQSVLEHAQQLSLKLYVIDVKTLAASLCATTTIRNELESALAYLALFKLYIGQTGDKGFSSILKIGISAFGEQFHGIPLATLCKRAWEGLSLVDLSEASTLKNGENSETETKNVSLKFFEFNSIASQDMQTQTNIPLVDMWHTAAKHIIFPEAYAVPEPASDVEFPQQADLRPDTTERTYLITTSVNRRLTPREYDRNVFHLEFDTRGTGLCYQIGEALGVHGWNDEQEVLAFCQWYNVDPDQVITIAAPGRSSSQTIRHTRTIFQALQQQVDLFGRPPKSFYGALSKYATTREDQMALHFIASAEGSSTFKKLAEKDTVNFVDVLQHYRSAKPPIAELCELVGDIKPRHYSIASSQAAVGDRVDLLVVTVDWLTPSGSPKFGQCTRYLAGLKVGQKVTVSIKPSVMRLPPDPMQPIIMAGLGTGAAPFRAFMQHRAWLASQNIDVGPLLYYFGSRHRSQEYLYGEEIEAFVQDGVISHVGLAFSRDAKKKVYIQHKMSRDAETLVRMLSTENGVFYLCGPTWPVPDVYEALVNGLVKYTGREVEEAGDYLERLKEEERYVLEVY